LPDTASQATQRSERSPQQYRRLVSGKVLLHDLLAQSVSVRHSPPAAVTGAAEGDRVGFLVGDPVGPDVVGDRVGFLVGDRVGFLVGDRVGLDVVGRWVGRRVGGRVGGRVCVEFTTPTKITATSSGHAAIAIGGG